MKQLEFTSEQAFEVLSFIFGTPHEVFNYYRTHSYNLTPETNKVFIDFLITTHYASKLLYWHENNIPKKESYNELTKEQIDICCRYVSFTDIEEYLCFKRLTQEQKDVIFNRAVKSKDGLRNLSYTRTYRDLKPEQRKSVLTGLLSWTLKDESMRNRYNTLLAVTKEIEKESKKWKGKEEDEEF